MSDRTKICPNCGSEDIHRDNSRWLNSLGLDDIYVCSNCGYEGRFHLTIDADKKEEAREVIEEQVEADKLVNEVTEGTVNKWRLAVGFVFIFMSITPMFFSQHAGNILIGLISLIIGAVLVRDEFVKLG